MESSHNKMAVGNLMSPPEPQLIHSFDKNLTSATMSQKKPTYTTQPGFLSPPISPANTHVRPEVPQHINGVVNDPILYAQSETSSTSQPPLFPSTVLGDIAAQVDQHIISERARRKADSRATLPQREEYLLAIEFKACMMQSYSSNPTRWVNRERQFLQDQQRARNAALKKASLASAPKKTYPVLAPSPSGVQKVRPSTKPQVRTPKPRRERTSATPDAGGGRSRNTGTSTREDKDFMALRDRSPPLSSLLPLKKKALFAEWKGQELDLSNDPHRHLLHPDELSVAAKLRLDCATYLTSKRRIFLARYECYKGTWGGAGKGKKEFRKTDAQQACKIDVNKASKLWMAFDRVKWFDEKYVRGEQD